ncbi:sulfatase-like hydrolase/transferase [Clostridia bacterium OttesenSCG-928-F22]|nr:sulfatase-like hydrolase/transferase [Clostridia bacterium OttesenSCG-928-F22]
MREKMKLLMADDRPFKKRLLWALLVGFGIAFTFVIFGVLEYYFMNTTYFRFELSQFIMPLLLVFFIVFVVISGILLLLKGRLFNLAVSVLVGVLLAGYIQANFLNGVLGVLDGAMVQWHRHTMHAILNFIIWVVIILVPVALCYFNKKVWSIAMKVVPALLIVVQLAGLMSVAFSAPAANVASQNPVVLSGDGLFELSKKDNIIVFILDKLDGKYVDELLEKSPEYEDKLDGFTYYRNSTSSYLETFPAVTYMLTGDKFYYESSMEDYYKRAYQNSTFLKELKAHNYTNGIYTDETFGYTDANDLADIADNVVETQSTVEASGVVKKFLKLTAYRYSPYVFKPSFWTANNEFDAMVENKAYKSDPRIYKRLLKDGGFSVQEEKNTFKYIHLQGAHGPFHMDENANQVPDSTMVQQLRGCYKLLFDYMDEMKRQGIYEDATIIITGDHGDAEEYTALTDYKTVGFFMKPKGSAKTPLAYSSKPIAHADFHATILDAAGIPYEQYGQSIFDIDENADRVRWMLYHNHDEKMLDEFEIHGNAEDFNNWKLVRRRNI